MSEATLKSFKQVISKEEPQNFTLNEIIRQPSHTHNSNESQELRSVKREPSLDSHNYGDLEQPKNERLLYSI